MMFVEMFPACIGRANKFLLSSTRSLQIIFRFFWIGFSSSDSCKSPSSNFLDASERSSFFELKFRIKFFEILCYVFFFLEDLTARSFRTNHFSNFDSWFFTKLEKARFSKTKKRRHVKWLEFDRKLRSWKKKKRNPLHLTYLSRWDTKNVSIIVEK